MATGIEENEVNQDSSKIKNAASLLLKGGTLTNEPCPKCGGVLIRFKDRASCINCGQEINDSVRAAQTNQQDSKKKNGKEQMASDTPKELQSLVAVVEDKIARLAEQISAEDDIAIQKQKAELIEIYLRILERARDMSKGFRS
jgi:uncharacterized Zn finger protein (UPF0148 family)